MPLAITSATSLCPYNLEQRMMFAGLKKCRPITTPGADAEAIHRC